MSAILQCLCGKTFRKLWWLNISQQTTYHFDILNNEHSAFANNEDLN